MDYNPPGSSVHGMSRARILGSHSLLWSSLLAQMVKNLPAMQETWVQCLGWEDPLGDLPWQPTPVFLPGESPWTEEPAGLQSMGSQRIRRLSD